MPKKQLTRVQHFVPRFILKKFLDSGKFKFFDKRYKKFLSKNAKGSMYKEYFYEHDEFNPNELEDLLKSREDIYAPIIEKLIAKESLTLEEHKTLIEFRHITYYRSNEFIGFHTYKKDRGYGSAPQREDWRRINAIFDLGNIEKDIKKSQLRAIKDVINKKDSAYQLSSLVPICIVAIASDKKFGIGDNGSISIGEEFDGITIIVISPYNALIFPKTRSALEFMKVLKVSNQQSTVIYAKQSNTFVEAVNRCIFNRAFEYYVDPNS